MLIRSLYCLSPLQLSLLLSISGKRRFAISLESRINEIGFERPALNIHVILRRFMQFIKVA